MVVGDRAAARAAAVARRGAAAGDRGREPVRGLGAGRGRRRICPLPRARRWRRGARRSAAAIEELPGAQRPQLVHAIGVPVGAIVAGERIATALDVPLIADLGDPWPAPDEAAQAERARALGGAAALVTTTPALAERLRPELARGTEIALIPNGGEIRRRPDGPPHEPPLFVHMGAINAGRIDPAPAFAALAALHREGRIEFRSHTTGFAPGLGDLPHPHLPLLGHSEALELTAAASAALVLGNDDPAQLPSKAFEIACTETWALCVGEPDADPAAELLARSGHAVRAQANEPAAIRTAAEEILAREQRGERPEPDPGQSWAARIDALETLLGELAP